MLKITEKCPNCKVLPFKAMGYPVFVKCDACVKREQLAKVVGETTIVLPALPSGRLVGM